MDIASLIGVIIGTVCLFLVALHTSHGHFAMFYSIEGVLCVFGGSISVCFMSMPMQKLKCVMGYLRRFMFYRARELGEIIELIKNLSEKSRRDGILALESDRQEAEKVDPFLATGLRMLIDGIEPAVIEKALRLEVLAMQDRHKAGKKFFDLIKLYGVSATSSTSADMSAVPRPSSPRITACASRSNGPWPWVQSW